MKRNVRFSLEELAPFLLPMVPYGEVAPPIIWRDLFGNDQPVEVEIGFGKGLFLNTAGAACPNVNFFGVEIIRKYQLLAAHRLRQNGLSNVRVACADGGQVLRERVAAQSVQAVHVYFPDPWWKARHKKRRVFTPLFAHSAARVLQPGGRLHLVTDVEEYFGVQRAIVAGLGSAFQELPPIPATEATHDMDYLTNFERKFRKEGRPIYRAAYERTLAAAPTEVGADPGLLDSLSGE